MKRKFPLQAIQQEICHIATCDGWLIYDFHGHNSIALEVLQIPPSQMLSRRFFYWIPRSGEPVKIVHQIEEDALEHLPGIKRCYNNWKSLEIELLDLLRGTKHIAMEHSKIPTISKLDSGTFEWLEQNDITPICSWPIAEHFICRLTSTQFNSHKQASNILTKAYKSAWELVKQSLETKKVLTEYDLQQYLLEQLTGYTTDHPPIVAIGANAALPHYFPTKTRAAQIKQGQLLLIDLWAKKKTPNSVYADITQVAYIGKKAPAELHNLYDITLGAQASAIIYIQKRLSQKKTIRGCDVDDACRSYLQTSGYGDYFVHRTGHNISKELHGLGPNLDNFETNDTRELLSNTLYSIEPGIYIPGSIGIRLECNLFIHDNHTLEITGQSYPKLPCLL